MDTKAQRLIATLRRSIRILGRNNEGHVVMQCRCGAVSDDLDDASNHKDGCRMPTLIEQVYPTFATHLAAIIVGY